MRRSLPEIQEIVRGGARRLTGADGATFVLRDGVNCVYADEDAIEPLWKGPAADSVLLKAGRLSPEEFEVIKSHAEAGAAILASTTSEERAAVQPARMPASRSSGSAAASRPPVGDAFLRI